MTDHGGYCPAQQERKMWNADLGVANGIRCNGCLLIYLAQLKTEAERLKKEIGELRGSDVAVAG